MKKILLTILPALLVLVSCRKQEILVPPVDESIWLSKDRGVVIFTDFSCPYYVVETNRGYAVLRSWGSGVPFEGSVLYGNFRTWGVTSFYNRSAGYIISADVRANSLSYWQAMDELDWNCSTRIP